MREEYINMSEMDVKWEVTEEGNNLKLIKGITWLNGNLNSLVK